MNNTPKQRRFLLDLAEKAVLETIGKEGRWRRGGYSVAVWFERELWFTAVVPHNHERQAKKQKKKFAKLFSNFSYFHLSLPAHQAALLPQ